MLLYRVKKEQVSTYVALYVSSPSFFLPASGTHGSLPPGILFTTPPNTRKRKAALAASINHSTATDSTSRPYSRAQPTGTTTPTPTSRSRAATDSSSGSQTSTNETALKRQKTAQLPDNGLDSASDTCPKVDSNPEATENVPLVTPASTTMESDDDFMSIASSADDFLGTQGSDDESLGDGVCP